MINPPSAAWLALINVSQGPMTAASAVVVATPPRSPANVLLGLTCGATRMRPRDLPHRYWKMSFDSVQRIKSSSSAAPAEAALVPAGHCGSQRAPPAGTGTRGEAACGVAETARL